MTAKAKNYALLIQQAHSLLAGETDLIANMSNLVALLFHGLPNLNGVAYYRFKEGELILGPFQGKPACMHIQVGRGGVCGTVAQTRKTEIVANVHEFAGHIACDAASKSEIVVPVFKDTKFWGGVLDLDSPAYGTFDEVDKKYLLELAPVIFGETANLRQETQHH
nr:GAF domain-containing protein [Liquorilactobacillus satsumensis]